MPKSRNNRKNGRPAVDTTLPLTSLPEPYATAVKRLTALGVKMRAKRRADGHAYVELGGYENHTDQDPEDVLHNAAHMDDEEWAAYLCPKEAHMVPAPEPMRARCQYVLMPFEVVAPHAAQITGWPVVLDRPEDALSGIREALNAEPVEISLDGFNYESRGPIVHLDNLALTFTDKEAPTDPVLSALFAACAPIHPFTDPEVLRLGRALTRDVGHGRRLLISGDILTADDPPRLIARFDDDEVIEELADDYDLGDPLSAVHILGHEWAEDVAELILMGGDYDEEDHVCADCAEMMEDEDRPAFLH